MPFAPPKHCPRGHPAFSGPRCPACTAAYRAAADARRPNAQQRGYDGRWQRESKAFLALPGNGVCACGCGRASDMVDHRTPHKGDRRLFWDRSNWQPMARACNSRKAAREEGGFGNQPASPGGRGRVSAQGEPDRVGGLARNIPEIGRSGGWEFGP